MTPTTTPPTTRHAKPVIVSAKELLAKLTPAAPTEAPRATFTGPRMVPQHGTVELSRQRLAHNLAVVRRRAGRAAICATLKANAYGHGVDLLAGLLEEEGVHWGCVYSLQEAMDLAHTCPLNLLVLAPLVWREPSPDMIRRVLEWGGERVRFNLTDAHSARCLSESITAVDPARRWPVHMQIDAGLTRMGVHADEAADLAALIGRLPGLVLEGVFAHFSHGDVPGHISVGEQRRVFHLFAEPLKRAQQRLLLHVQNSGGALHLGDVGLDMARVGIALYGLQPSVEAPIADLLPVARVTAPILSIHDRPAGTGVGYGHTFVTQRPTRVAVVPIGYADGYPRALSNRGVTQVRGRDVPVVGRVSMDQITLDVTDVPGADMGDEVTVISGDASKPNCLDRMAESIGTIGYELATHLGPRLKRVVVA